MKNYKLNKNVYILMRCSNELHYISDAIFNKVFRRKTLVIIMMNVGGRAVCRAGVNNSFPEHNSATVRNISMILDRIIEKVSIECRVQE